MPRRPKIYGPWYDERRGHYRVVVFQADGKRFDVTYRSRKKAERAVEERREEIELGSMTVGEGIDEYLDYQRAKGNREGTIKTTGYRLRSLLAPASELMLLDLDPKRAQKLYDQYAKSGASVDTHRNALGQARTFGRWAAKRGYAPGNPFADVEGVGRRSRGKAQLTIDEARRFASHCVAIAPGDRHAVGALICLGLGLRASEACGLEARDLDDEGAQIVVRGTKTDAARRRLAVPEWLRGALEGALPLGLTRYSLRDGILRLCRDAGVTEVGPHGLRGTHSSIAAEAGAASELVAASLGHSSIAVTESHYSTPESRATARARKVGIRLLDGGRGKR